MCLIQPLWSQHQPDGTTWLSQKEINWSLAFQEKIWTHWKKLVLQLWYTCYCSSTTQDGWMGRHWQMSMKHPMKLTHTPSNCQTPPSFSLFQLSLNTPWHEAIVQLSPPLSRDCSWHTISWHFDRSPQIWLWKKNNQDHCVWSIIKQRWRDAF